MNLPDLNNLKVGISKINDGLWLKKNIGVSMLRLDKISPIPGNKIFKLYYFLQQAIVSGKKIITFGGAYSNHLTATAAACNYYQLQSIGILRGEKPPALSPALSYCIQQGMQLEFISRNAYKLKEDEQFLRDLESQFGAHVLIPEGGYSLEGVKGASKIYECTAGNIYTHICCSVGTATTLAGLISLADPAQKVIGFSALKGLTVKDRLSYLLGSASYQNYQLIGDYHFGGYAKRNNELIHFMNVFYENHSIALDFVYNGKMMYGLTDLISKDYFAAGSEILCIHTGGLQGNASIPAGVLNF